MPTPQQTLASADRSLTRLDELFGLFGEDPPEHNLMASTDVPEVPRSLLDHERHMTVTLENFHQAPVTLTVLQRIHQDPFYARKILLTTNHPTHTTTVVQYGIMRFDLRRVSAKVRKLIVGEELPLGRILIENEVLRRITTHGLLALDPTPEIRTAIGMAAVDEQESSADPTATRLYGRLATILCNESPAVDLLEVVTGYGSQTSRNSTAFAD